MAKLALHGGKPVRTALFPHSCTTGEEEIQAVTEVLKTGLLSGFLGSPSPEFYGGPMVKKLEKAWSEKFQVKHSVSCNSATSALIMAIGAAAVGPGDEVIVSPYTMSATATSIIFYGGIPVFADIEPDYFCLDPESIRERITSRTKAILTTNIHGQSSDMEKIVSIAKEHQLLVIEDCAQAPGAKLQEKFAGTIGDIGIYSLNRHKNIQCGEGGIAVTNDDELALRMQLIRNHGENLVDKPGYAPMSLVNMLGFNFRMTEIEAAIAFEQLKKLDTLNQHRINLAEFLNEKMNFFPGLTMPAVRDGATHVYYMHVMLYDEQETGVSRNKFIEAVRAEGIPIWGGYLKPLYLEPLYQQQTAIGDQGFPFIGGHYPGIVNYRQGLCPVAEELFEKKTIINPYVYPPLTICDMQDIVKGIEKVLNNKALLQTEERI
jgi:dTDP-4-amino-4,6-dideoxygalactose transaminase